jgi:hypothetical protein
LQLRTESAEKGQYTFDQEATPINNSGAESAKVFAIWRHNHKYCQNEEQLAHVVIDVTKNNTKTPSDIDADDTIRVDTIPIPSSTNQIKLVVNYSPHKSLGKELQ